MTDDPIRAAETAVEDDALVDRERLACVAAARSLLLHDLANVGTVLDSCREGISTVAAGLASGFSPALVEELREEAADLDEAVRRMLSAFNGPTTWAIRAQAGPRDQLAAALLGAVKRLVDRELAGSPGMALSCPADLAIRVDALDVATLVLRLSLLAGSGEAPTGPCGLSVEVLRDGDRVKISFDGLPGERAAQPGADAVLRLRACQRLAAAGGYVIEVPRAGAGAPPAFRLTVPASST